MRMSLSMSIVPGASPDTIYYMLYVTTQLWHNGKPKMGPTVLEKKVYFPEGTPGRETEWAIEICDAIYQQLTMQYAAEVNDRHNGETNARPGDTSVPS